MDRDEVSGLRVGSSLPVPNVQELAATSIAINVDKIPDRYIRPEVEANPVAHADNVELPIIDMCRLLDPKLCREESAKLKMACEEWGFFQLVNHGISEDLMNKMKADTIDFFKLSLKEKMAFSQLPNSLEGYGHAFVTSEEQKLDWADMMYIITRPPASRNMRFWPTNPPSFRDTLDMYSTATGEVAERLLGLMAWSLGIDPEILLIRFRDRSQAMRINYYPPCPEANTVLGLSPHTDGVALTLLLQINETQGLQIKKDGKWLPVEILPGALIANVGDVLEIMSNGRFKSIEHRAMIDFRMERLSIATFHSPSDEVVVGPLPELVEDGEKKYKSMGYADYMKIYFSAKLDGRSHLESIKLTK